MPYYRRSHEDGAVYFLTVVTHQRRTWFGSALGRRLLGEAIRATLADRPADVRAIVLLPNHVHTLWLLPPGDVDYSTRIRLIKRRFTRAWLAPGGQEGPSTPSRQHRGIRGVWQKRFYEHTIRNSEDYVNHMTYIHMNPVKHDLVARPIDWPWSSFHRYLRQGEYPPDWMGPLDIPGIGDCDSEIW